MNCPKCRTKIDAAKKFCTECGTALSVICSRCGNTNGNNDKFCGSCGLLLKGTAQELSMHEATQTDARQYNGFEIDDLLSLRRKVQKELESSKTVSQQDLDNLFR